MCEYCELKEPLDTWGERIIDEHIHIGLISDFTFWNAINVRRKQFTFAYDCIVEGDIDIPINYCPMCGRKLSIEKPYDKPVGEVIREIRKERGMTCKQLGEALGISDGYIRSYEKGRRNPKLKALVKLADALDVDVDVFLKIMLADANGKDGNNG